MFQSHRNHPESGEWAVRLVQQIREMRKIQWEPSRLLCYGETLPFLMGDRRRKAVGAVHLNKGDSCKCRLGMRNPGNVDLKLSFPDCLTINVSLPFSRFSPLYPTLPSSLSLMPVPSAWTASSHVSRTWRFASVGSICMTRWTRAKPLSSRMWLPAHPPTWPWPSTTSWTLSTTRWMGSKGEGGQSWQWASRIVFSSQT